MRSRVVCGFLSGVALLAVIGIPLHRHDTKGLKGLSSPRPAAPSPASQTPSPARQTPSPASQTPSPARQTPSPARQTPSPASQTPKNPADCKPEVCNPEYPDTCWNPCPYPTSPRPSKAEDLEAGLKVRTYLNRPAGAHCLFEGSVALSGLNMDIDGWASGEAILQGKPPGKVVGFNFMQKIASALAVVDNTDPWVMLAFVDSTDLVSLAEDPEEVTKKYLDWEDETGKFLMYAGETLCSQPTAEFICPLNETMREHLYPYLNSGVIVGRAFALKWFVQGLYTFARTKYKNPGAIPLADQAVTGESFYRSGRVRQVLGIDHNGVMSLTLIGAWEPWHICFENRRWTNKKSKGLSTPVFFHAAGWGQQHSKSILRFLLEPFNWKGVTPQEEVALIEKRLQPLPRLMWDQEKCAEQWLEIRTKPLPREATSVIAIEVIRPTYGATVPRPHVCRTDVNGIKTLVFGRLFTFAAQNYKTGVEGGKGLPDEKEPVRLVLRLLSDPSSTKPVEEGDIFGAFTEDGAYRVATTSPIPQRKPSDTKTRLPERFHFRVSVTEKHVLDSPLQYNTVFTLVLGRGNAAVPKSGLHFVSSSEDTEATRLRIFLRDW